MVVMSVVMVVVMVVVVTIEEHRPENGRYIEKLGSNYNRALNSRTN